MREEVAEIAKRAQHQLELTKSAHVRCREMIEVNTKVRDTLEIMIQRDEKVLKKMSISSAEILSEQIQRNRMKLAFVMGKLEAAEEIRRSPWDEIREQADRRVVGRRSQ